MVTTVPVSQSFNYRPEILSKMFFCLKTVKQVVSPLLSLFIKIRSSISPNCLNCLFNDSTKNQSNLPIFYVSVGITIFWSKFTKCSGILKISLKRLIGSKNRLINLQFYKMAEISNPDFQMEILPLEYPLGTPAMWTFLLSLMALFSCCLLMLSGKQYLTIIFLPSIL